MHRAHAVEISFHPVGQRVVGRIHIGEQRIAAHRRTGLDVQNAAHRRFRVAGHIAVPAFAVGTRRVFVGADDHQFTVPRRMRRGRVDVQFAEAAAEIQMLLRRQILVAEEDHQVFGEGALNFGERGVAQWLGQIHPADFRPDHRCEFVHRNGFIRCAAVRHMADARATIAA